MSTDTAIEQVLFHELGLSHQTHFYVAYSGGLDSTVLLYLMHRLQQQHDFALTALHVDHGLHQDSGQWAAHCAQVCQHMGIPLQQTRLNLVGSSEAEARSARYDWFRQRVVPKSVLLTAHHMQDRAETLLFNLMRGAGSAGLSSLRRCRPFYHATLVRPMLEIAKSEIQQVALDSQLDWVEDPSNEQTEYARNRLRQQVVPVLTQFREDAIRNIARAGANLEQETRLMREVAIADLVDVRELSKHPIDESYALNFDDMTHLSRTRKANLVRFWLQSLNQHIPSKRLMDALLDGFDEPPTTTAIFQEEGCQFRFYRGYLYVMPAREQFPTFSPVEWADLDRTLSLFDSRLTLEPTPQLKALVDKQRRSRLRLVSREGVVNPKALQGHSVNLKKWLQDSGVPPWRRHVTPLLTLGQRNSDIVLAPIDHGSHNEWISLAAS